jgi:hypothetical protein
MAFKTREEMMAARNKEEKLVMGVYAFITLRLSADQLLSPFLVSTLVRLFELVFLSGMFWCAFRIWTRGARARYQGWPLLLILLYAMNCIGIMARGDFSVGLKSLVMDKLNGADAILAYTLPFVVLSLPNRKYFRSILEVLFLSMLLTVPIWLLNITELVREEYLGEAIGVYLPFYGTVLLLFRRKLPRGWRLVTYAIFFIYLLLMVLNARRNVIVSLFLYFSVAFIVGNLALIRSNRKFLMGGIAVAILMGGIAFASWESLSQSVFRRLIDRSKDDTRSRVELFFLVDMSSAPARDWVFGRGMDGSYYQMVEDLDENSITYDRKVIETGYLHMILKGGIVNVLLILLILFTAFYQGIKSGKILIKGLACFLPIYLIDLYMTNPVSFFAVRTVIFWLIVSICFQSFQWKAR